MGSHRQHIRLQARASHHRAQHTHLLRQLTLRQVRRTAVPIRFLQPHRRTLPHPHHTLPLRQATVQHPLSILRPLQSITRQAARRHPSIHLRRLNTAPHLRRTAPHLQHTVRPRPPTHPLLQSTGGLREAQKLRLRPLATAQPARFTVQRARCRTSTLLARPQARSTRPLRLNIHQSKFGCKIRSYHFVC